MYTLKGLFPEPKKEPKKNFIKENMKQLKLIQGKSPKEPKLALKSVTGSRLTNHSGNSLAPVKSSPSSKSGKATLNVGKTCYSNVRKNARDVRIKKGDMAEFLKRKEKRQAKPPVESAEEDELSEEDNEDSSGRCRDIGCQTVETNFSYKESAKLTMLYPLKNDDSEAKLKASGDSGRQSPATPHRRHTPRRTGDSDLLESEKRSRINAILERKDTKDPYLPSGYQKGVVPKYLRTRKEAETKEAEAEVAGEDMACPPGHVALPDAERKETLRMLRNSFAELVSELNKMPVKTDTLRMRNRKMELEKQLAKLEEGIKVFSRPRVFVKIGE